MKSFPIDATFSDEQFWLNSARLHGKRLELIASNIANADTPNYKAKDIDFRLALAHSMSVANGTDSSTENITKAEFRPTLLFRVPFHQGIDGNTVDLDLERTTFTMTAIHYEFAIKQAVEEYKEIAQLYKNMT
jgi:flagellar basal-body rod protein FlgB